MVITASGILRVLSSKIMLRRECVGMNTSVWCEAATVSRLCRLGGAPASSAQLCEGICACRNPVLHQMAQKGCVIVIKLCPYKVSVGLELGLRRV